MSRIALRTTSATKVALLALVLRLTAPPVPPAAPTPIALSDTVTPSSDTLALRDDAAVAVKIPNPAAVPSPPPRTLPLNEELVAVTS